MLLTGSLRCPRPVGHTGNAPERTPLPPVPAGCLARPLRGSGRRILNRRNDRVMTATEVLTLIERADERISYEQFRTWVVAQAVRNALQTFHGCWAFDPDDPGSEAGFISDGQMRALNITIRRAVHEALGHADTARSVAGYRPRRKLSPGEEEALD